MSIILLSFDSFSFSIFIDDFCVMAGTVQLIWWSGRVRQSFSFSSLNCFSGLVLLCFFFIFVRCFHTFHDFELSERDKQVKLSGHQLSLEALRQL